MSEHSAARFLVEIDGKQQDFCNDIASAKQKAISLANGVSSVKITDTGIMPQSAWCWDYTKNAWVFSQNAVFAEAKRKGE